MRAPRPRRGVFGVPAKRSRGVRGAAQSEESRALPGERLARKTEVGPCGEMFRAGAPGRRCFIFLQAGLRPEPHTGARAHARARTCAPRGRGVGLSGSPRSGRVGCGAQPRLKKVAPCQANASPGQPTPPFLSDLRGPRDHLAPATSTTTRYRYSINRPSPSIEIRSSVPCTPPCSSRIVPTP